MKNILFVCTGNTCRSPMAEAILKHKYPSQFNVKSAGVYAGQGMPASEGTQNALQAKGIPCEHQSQPVSKEVIDWADLILTMTEEHKQALIMEFPETGRKVFTLKEYVNIDSNESRDIMDPFGGPQHVYEKTFEELEKYVELLVEKLENEDEIG
ncbi:low molecular weight protein arginine phosphatase [Bacillaceae bacterium S4-13-58]